jgi:hypothetical protein
MSSRVRHETVRVQAAGDKIEVRPARQMHGQRLSEQEENHAYLTGQRPTRNGAAIATLLLPQADGISGSRISDPMDDHLRTKRSFRNAQAQRSSSTAIKWC